MHDPNVNKMADVFLNQKSCKMQGDAVPENTKKAMKFGLKVFKG